MQKNIVTHAYKANEDSHLAVLDWSAYMKIFEKFMKKEIEAKAKFFENIPFLNHWNKNSLMRFV